MIYEGPCIDRHALLRGVFSIASRARAEKSRIIYRHGPNGRFETSWLGLLNGIIASTGYSVFAIVEAGTVVGWGRARRPSARYWNGPRQWKVSRITIEKTA